MRGAQRLRHLGRLQLAVLAVALFLATIASPAGARVFSDQADDQPGVLQVHLLYLVPSDSDSFSGLDRGLDDNGTIANETASWGRWLNGQTGGYNMRLDLHGGALDVTYVQLGKTEAQLRAAGTGVVDAIDTDLRQKGFNKSNKVYLGYYDGIVDPAPGVSCGIGSWTSGAKSNFAVVLPRAKPQGAPECSTNSFAAPNGAPGYLQFVAVHELLHVLGFVPSCATHSVGGGHVGDDPRDLMYAGPAAWQPSILDVGHDDYFNAGIPGCQDLATSGWLGPGGGLSGSAIPGSGKPAPTASKKPTPKLRPTGPKSVRAGHRFKLGLKLSARAGRPTGSCVLRRRRGHKYKLVARKKVRKGRCAFALRAPRHGVTKLRYRLTFSGTRGWPSATVKRTVTVHH
jgi:hypothetical protein